MPVRVDRRHLVVPAEHRDEAIRVAAEGRPVVLRALTRRDRERRCRRGSPRARPRGRTKNVLLLIVPPSVRAGCADPARRSHPGTGSLLDGRLPGSGPRETLVGRSSRAAATAVAALGRLGMNRCKVAAKDTYRRRPGGATVEGMSTTVLLADRETVNRGLLEQRLSARRVRARRRGRAEARRRARRRRGGARALARRGAGHRASAGPRPIRSTACGRSGAGATTTCRGRSTTTSSSRASTPCSAGRSRPAEMLVAGPLEIDAAHARRRASPARRSRCRRRSTTCCSASPPIRSASSRRRSCCATSGTTASSVAHAHARLARLAPPPQAARARPRHGAARERLGRRIPAARHAVAARRR